jgi:hypothetical protein
VRRRNARADPQRAARLSGEDAAYLDEAGLRGLIRRHRTEYAQLKAAKVDVDD